MCLSLQYTNSNPRMCACHYNIQNVKLFNRKCIIMLLSRMHPWLHRILSLRLLKRYAKYINPLATNLHTRPVTQVWCKLPQELLHGCLESFPHKTLYCSAPKKQKTVRTSRWAFCRVYSFTYNGYRVFPWGRDGRGVGLTLHTHLMPRS